MRSQCLKRSDTLQLYKTKDDFLFWLNEKKYLDEKIISTGEFEPDSTQAVRTLVQPGDVVIDVGANIGYYTILLQHLTGSTGKVLAFEPTTHYRDILNLNILENGMDNCSVYPVGLSNKTVDTTIAIGECSATLQWVFDQAPAKTETISLMPLDDFVTLHPEITRIDFIKVDLDGHEPAFLDGAWQTIERFKPVMLLEVAHEQYLDMGVTAWDFYEILKARGFFIYHEVNLTEITSRHDFLVKCANFDRSANIIISQNRIAIRG